MNFAGWYSAARRPDVIERLCEIQHDAYEAAAVREGWVTQDASRTSWAEVPDANKRTMRSAVRALLGSIPDVVIESDDEALRVRRWGADA